MGFAGFLQRLWESEQPESILVGWDSLDTPTYRHEALPAYQSGRVFEDSIVEQLDLLPALVESFGFQAAKARRLRGRRLPGGRRGRVAGAVLVATSDRDAFQLVSERVTILQPVKGVSELARIGPMRSANATASSRRRCRTSSRCAATRRTRSLARRESARRRQPTCSKQHGSLAQALADGRFSQIADELRLYRDIATMDPDAPLPELGPTPPDWAGAASTRPASAWETSPAV